MRTKEEIMKDAEGRGAEHDTLADMHRLLIVEILCDIRDDQLAHQCEMERLTNIRLGWEQFNGPTN